jgi:predicted AlkP superfamily phosphohydrolase/phosphomutase
LVVEPDDIPVDSVTRFIHLDTPQDREWYTNTKDYRIFDENSEAAMFKFSFPEDQTMVNAALHLLKTHGQPDFFAVYLDGMDSMEHKYLPYYFSQKHEEVLRPDNVARFKDLVPEYYVYMDEVLGKLLAVMDPNTTVIVVSDHGFDYGMQPNGNYNHENAPPGVFVIAGKDIKKGVQITTASVRDITPTVLQLFGLPVGRDMDGTVITGAFDMKNVPITYVQTYETQIRDRGRVEPSQLDEAIQERLRALGYTK